MSSSVVLGSDVDAGSARISFFGSSVGGLYVDVLEVVEGAVLSEGGFEDEDPAVVLMV